MVGAGRMTRAERRAAPKPARMIGDRPMYHRTRGCHEAANFDALADGRGQAARCCYLKAVASDFIRFNRAAVHVTNNATVEQAHATVALAK